MHHLCIHKLNYLKSYIKCIMCSNKNLGNFKFISKPPIEIEGFGTKIQAFEFIRRQINETK